MSLQTLASHPNQLWSMRGPLPRVFATACLLLLLISGCTNGTNASNQEIQVIQYWDYPRVPVVDKWQRDQMALFEQDHPGYKVKRVRLPWQSGSQRLDVAVFSGHPPDIACSVSNLIAYVEQGVVASWDDVLTEEEVADFYPSALAACTWDDQIWAIPYYKTAFIMLLNLNLFRKAGVDPPENKRWTWDEFVEKTQKLTLDEDGDGTAEQYGIGFNIFPEEFEAWGFLFSEGTEILSTDGRECLFNSPATVQGVQHLYDLVHKYKVAPLRSGSTRHIQTWDDFTNHWKTAITCQGIWSIAAQRRKNAEAVSVDSPEKRFGGPSVRVMDFSVALFPAQATAEPVLSSPGVGNVVVFDTGDPERVRLCQELVMRITSGKGQEILKEYPLFPTRKSAGNIFEGDPLLDDMLPHIVNAKVRPIHPEWINIDRILSKELQRAVLGEKPVAEAVEDGAVRVQWLLDRYYARKAKREKNR